MRVGITGHRGLSAEVERKVRALIEAAVTSYAGIGNAGLVGVSCLADGPDVWFARAVLDQAGRLEVVLPARQYRADLPTWHHPAYDDLLHRATRVHHTGLDTSGPDAYMAARPANSSWTRSTNSSPSGTATPYAATAAPPTSSHTRGDTTYR